MKTAESRFRQQKRKTKLQTEQKCRINGEEGKIAVLTARGYKAAGERHHEPPVLLNFSGFPG